MRNKFFFSSCFVILILSAFFFLFYSFKLERPFTVPLVKILGKSVSVIKHMDTLKIKDLNEKAFKVRHSKPNTTIQLADSALKLSKSVNYIAGVGESHRVKGIGYFYINNSEEAIYNYLEALKNFKSINDLKSEAKVYNNIGRLYSMHDSNKSLEYYSKALNLLKKAGDKDLASGVYFNIATVLQSQSKFKQALEYFKQSNKIFEAKKDTVNIIINLLHSGRAHYHLKNYQKAELRIKKAIQGAIEKKLYPTLIDSYTSLSKINYDQGLFDEAEKNIIKGLYYSEKIDNKQYEYDLLYAAYQLETKRKDHKKALDYLNKIHKYDSLLLVEHQSKNIGKSTENHLQGQKLKESEIKIEESKYKESFFWWTITIIFLLVLASILIGLGSYFIYQKIRKRKDLQTENRVNILEQKTLQGMMNPHFIFNVLNTIQYFINKNDPNEANKILNIFAKLMRKHLEICLKSSITLTEEIEYLNLYLSLEKIRFIEKMDYEVTIDKEINPEEIILPPLLLQPFVENAIWHGIIPKLSRGKISLNFTKKMEEIEIKIIDDGVGITNSKKNRSSNHISRGLELIQERIKLLNKLSVKNISINQSQLGTSGTKVLISIPL